MKVLITGGAGFIGSHLVERFLDRGDEVFVIDDLSTGSLAHLAAVRRHAGLHLNVDTILNHPVVNETVAKCDQVVHLAAAVGVRKMIDEPVETLTTNVRGTEIVLHCCQRHEVPFFLGSTSEVYGKEGDHLSEEDDRVMGSTTQPRWANACAEAFSEFLTLAYHQEFGLPVMIGRFFNTVGPRQTSQWGMVLPSFVGRALRGDPLQVHGSGEQRRSFCHVSDSVRAVESLLRDVDAWGGVFNIGSEDEVSIKTLAERVIEVAESPSTVETVSYEDAYGKGFEDLESRRPSTQRIRDRIGWKPEHGLEEIIRSAIEYARVEAAD